MRADFGMNQCTPSSRHALFPLLLLASLARGELRVEGVSDEIARNVQNYVALASEPCDAETWLVRRRFRAIETEARSALEPFGYYDPTIEKTLALDEKCWRATLRIDAGKPVVLRNIDVSIATPPEGTTDFYDIESSSPLVAGTPLRHADYETLKESLQVRAAERGYADASFTRNIIDVWPDERAADISLEYESGPRYDFGEIRIEDNFLEDSLVRAFSRIRYRDAFRQPLAQPGVRRPFPQRLFFADRAAARL